MQRFKKIYFLYIHRSIYKMKRDIFDNKILCGECGEEMVRDDFIKNGFVFRSLVCPSCGERLVHPLDEERYKKFNDLKKKQFSVKMRIVGNSYAISIPKEIVSFLKEQEKSFNDFVNLAFEDINKLAVYFFGGENEKSK